MCIHNGQPTELCDFCTVKSKYEEHQRLHEGRASLDQECEFCQDQIEIEQTNIQSLDHTFDQSLKGNHLIVDLSKELTEDQKHRLILCSKIYFRAGHELGIKQGISQANADFKAAIIELVPNNDTGEQDAVQRILDLASSAVKKP